VRQRTAVVTGGGSGIGRATALALQKRGANIVIADLSTSGGEETLGLIRAAGGTAIFVRTDVSQAAEVEAMVGLAVATFGGLDWAVNAAGYAGIQAHVGDLTESDFDLVYRVNLKGVWLCMKSEIRQMLAGGGGSIVNISSGGGLVAAPTLGGYSGAKAGVIGLSRTAAVEYATAGIRVNSICPGAIRTPMMQKALENAELAAIISAATPLGRMGEPEEIAACAAFLCSDEASFVTGIAMPVDGGVVAK
jgi:NAD(P)-dependent dehydrogenase (short-subunit alcohol dehydrogenase family)